MTTLVTEFATFMVLDSECSGRFKIHVNSQEEVTIKCHVTDIELGMELDELRLIYDAVNSVMRRQ